MHTTTLPASAALALAALLAGPAEAGPTTALPSQTAAQAGLQAPQAPQPRSRRAFTVDPLGEGDFPTFRSAAANAPRGSLILLAPGDHTGGTIQSKGLRVEALDPGTVRITEPLVITLVGPKQEVYLSGLLFQEGFSVENCAGDVTFADCVAIDDDVLGLRAPNLHFAASPQCGTAFSRHRVLQSSAVTFVDCSLEGRDGFSGCDGIPGEHGLMVEGSRVAVYGGSLVGGKGGDAYDCHGIYPGSGGDAIWAQGADARVFHLGVTIEGGTGGQYLDGSGNYACHGTASRSLDGAVIDAGNADPVTFDIDSLASPGDLPSYTLTAPPGAQIYLMVAPRRAWREFVPDEGLLHLDSSLQLIPLGVMSSSGSLTRPFPAPTPAWFGAYASVEIQAYARVAGQDRYSEPRTLQVTAVGQ